MDIGLKILMVMPDLLLQKPSYKSTAKENSECLSRRLSSWENGGFNKILIESRTIQANLIRLNKTRTPE